MVFGTCCICTDCDAESMKAESIEINGFQRGLLVNFEVIQTFIHYEEYPKEVSYIFPNDFKMCIYDTTFVIGDKIIKPKLQSKEEAEKTYEEAIESGHTAVYSSNINHGLTKFQLGDVQPETPVKIILKIAFNGHLTKEKTFYIKFPFDVCTPSGSLNCLDVDVSHFSFKLQCDIEKVSNVTSNVKNYHFNETTKLFSIENKTNEDSIIITFETKDQIKSSAFLTPTDQVNFDGCVVFISPNLPIKNGIKNSEFVFVVDCSGSMYGKKIKKASECLELFIKSLPPKSFFNVVRFGTRHEKLFNKSVIYNDANADSAIKLAQNLKADLGSTDIYTPLKSIFEEDKNANRQIFILTDGAVGDTELVLQLISYNSKNNRCFTIGIGECCDAGLVEGIASLSGGKSDFVQNEDSISEKVIPQLQSSLSLLFTSVEIHVQNDYSFEVSPYPIPSINANGSSVVYLREKKKEKNNFHNGILVTGSYENKQIEIQIEDIEQLMNVEEDEYGCSKGQNIGKCIIPLFSFLQLQKYERKYYISKEEKAKAIELSISSGVLCKYTGFVGMIENTNSNIDFSDIEDHLDEIIRIGNEQMKLCSQIGCELDMDQCCCDQSCYKENKEKSKPGWFSNFFRKIFRMSNNNEPKNDEVQKLSPPPPSPPSTKIELKNDDEVQKLSLPPPSPPSTKIELKNDDENVPLKYDLITISRYQKVDGYWNDLNAVQQITGLKIDYIDEINLNDKNVENMVIATIIAIAAIRVKSAKEKNSWVLIEEKAVSWLKKIMGEKFDIQKVILKVESLF